MADNRLDNSRDQKLNKQQHDDPIGDALGNCGLLASGSGTNGKTQKVSPTCNLPSVSIEADKAAVDGVATELRRTILFGAKSWVYPDAVLNAMRDAAPNDAGKFESKYSEYQHGNLRQELKDHLSAPEYRTAIAILENRENQKRTADDMEESLKKLSGSKPSLDKPGILLTLKNIDPEGRVTFERDFPKNEGEDLTLRGELKKYLGDGSEYRQAITLLDEAGEPRPTAATKAPAQSSIREWLSAFDKLNKTLKISNVPNVDPNAMNERDFKAAYARETVRLGHQYGFTPEQVKEIGSSMYALEAGGWGTSYTTANMPLEFLKPNREAERLDFHPATSAVGYNQLLKSCTMDILQYQGSAIAARLSEMSAAQGASTSAIELAAKSKLIKTLSKMIGDDQIPNGMSKKEFGDAVQALNMDKDVGPLIQAQQLGNLLRWYQTRKEQHDNHNVNEVLQTTAARINAKFAEYDHLPQHQKVDAINKLLGLAKPAPNQREAAAHLTTKLQSLKPGLAGTLQLSPPEKQLLTAATKRAGDIVPQHPIQALLNKLDGIRTGIMTAAKLTPAALELANLAGQGGANSMLKHPHEPTYKYFSGAALTGNAIARNKDGEKLLIDIYATMQQKRSQPYLGNVELRDAFERARQNKI
jgi:hypothetical protein